MYLIYKDLNLDSGLTMEEEVMGVVPPTSSHVGPPPLTSPLASPVPATPASGIHYSLQLFERISTFCNSKKLSRNMVASYSIYKKKLKGKKCEHSRVDAIL